MFAASCLLGRPRCWRSAAAGADRLRREPFAVGVLLAGLVADLVGLVAAAWVIAALTAASGLVIAVRTYEIHGRLAVMTADGSGAPLRFATFLAPNMLPLYRFLAERIARRLGRPAELVVGVSFDQFERGEVDLGVICGLPYVWLAARQPRPVEPLAAPVLVGDRYAGRPVYYSDVIVRRDSPITCLEELRGCSWAYNEPASHSGHTATLYALVRMGARPGFFARVVEAGFHQQAIRLVHGGAVDAAAIDSQVLAVELRDHPDLAGLRVVGAFGPSTIQPVVAASRLPRVLKDQVRDLLVELVEDPGARTALAHGLVDRFAPVDDGAFDDIRAMLATIEAAGWTSLAQTAVYPT